jgi:hypothetical protein
VPGTIILPASVDVSSLDTRLLGRVKVLDSGGAVIDPAKEHATAANPSSARLSDGTSYLGTTAGRLQVADGGVSLGVQAPAASPVAVRMSDGAAYFDPRIVDTELPAAAALADGAANPTSPMVGANGLLFNGATWDRMPTASQAHGSATAPAAAMMVFDSTSSTYSRVRTMAADGLAIAAQVPALGLALYNGTNYDRLRGDASGMLVHGDVDHDAVNTLKNEQIAGHASPVDVPPASVSAAGDRVRAWFDRSGAQIVRRRKIRETYTAVFRLAETTARLDQTFTQVANTTKQWATLHHTAGATKEVRLQKCVVWITGWTTVAMQAVLELRQISAAPATGNPAITPTPRRRGGTAAEAVALYLPTTAGTEANANSPLAHIPFDYGIMGAVSTANPLAGLEYGPGSLLLYDSSQEDDEAMPPVLPVGTLDGWAVCLRSVGAPVVRLTCMMVFTEEIP